MRLKWVIRASSVLPSPVEADFFHRHVEATTVFCFINRVGGRTNHGHAELFQHALTLQLQRTVQRALNCALELERQGVLEEFGVTMIGATADAIDKAEDRRRFDVAMKKIGLDR